MKQLPDAVFVVDIKHELTAVKEARRLEIPIFAIVDSNSDPQLVEYPIPANDDSLRAVQLVVAAFADGIIAARGGKSFEEGAGAEGEVEAVAETPPNTESSRPAISADKVEKVAKQT